MIVGQAPGLRHLGYIDLPAHVGRGGFDHAAVHGPRGLLYAAHTANDAVDVIDLRADRYIRSISGLKGVAGALVDEGSDLVFTSNRGEDTVSILTPDGDGPEAKVGVGMRPNGLAYDPARGLLLSANVGNVDVAGSYSVSLVDVRARTIVAGAAVPGRTRWTVFDPSQGVFFVNIMDPPRIAVVDPAAGGLVARLIDVPAGGPHGLDVDPPKGRLYCACDDGTAVCLDSRSGRSLETLKLSGAPDVVFLNRALRRLYVAIGDPGVVDVIDVSSWRRVETVETERGAHTIAFEEGRNRVYAFLPETHRASVYEDRV